MNRSPFPGMDPYLEAHWRGVHTSLMVYIVDQIQDQLPADLVARIEESVRVDAEDDDMRVVVPDVHVVENDIAPRFLKQTVSNVGVAEPLLVLEDMPQTDRHVQILDLSSGDRVVTVIEVISPSNKRTRVGRDEYRKKQRDYVHSGVNLVEIDLLRGGRHVLVADLERIPESKRRPYLMCVKNHTQTILYGAALQDRLPTISIPLRMRDRDVTLSIQRLIDVVYERGRYGRMDYRKEPDPPFSLEDAEWANALLRDQGRR